MHVERWAFDAELLFLAERMYYRVCEIPVNWHEVDGSKIVPILSWIQMGRDLVVIWFRYFIGTWNDDINFSWICKALRALCCILIVLCVSFRFFIAFGWMVRFEMRTFVFIFFFLLSGLGNLVFWTEVVLHQVWCQWSSYFLQLLRTKKFGCLRIIYCVVYENENSEDNSYSLNDFFYLINEKKQFVDLERSYSFRVLFFPRFLIWLLVFEKMMPTILFVCPRLLFFFLVGFWWRIFAVVLFTLSSYLFFSCCLFIFFYYVL